MKPRRFHGLKRPKLRQSWNKYNLYNIARFRDPRIGIGLAKTFFQQKWRAKGILRTYHGEHIPERKWERMFSRRLLGVVEMDAKYMAEYDGSEMAAGRGSGKDEIPRWGHDTIYSKSLTPYMQMAFAPMERRLDIAVFRAMFASSARQARQFCVHGAVKVNGKVMPYPAYRLNPGDMFQVNPERVMYATGAKKEYPTVPAYLKQPSSSAEAEDDTDAPAQEEAEASTGETETKAAETERDPETTDAPEPAPVDMKPTRKQIQQLTKHAKTILADEGLSAKQKQTLRKFIKEMRPMLSRASKPNATPEAVASELASLVSELSVSQGGSDPPAADTAASATSRQDNNNKDAASSSEDPFEGLDNYEVRKLQQRMAEHLREEQENPRDRTKPYKTPWEPRPYMSPFAFIPKYLEVNQNVCSAVYLRHPVARVGHAEVPTPYPYGINQLGFNWYLRRR
ncbi:hypothetical protein F4779DRAFT_607616 [Xylariaceae sp. FL0662B]|nr:hypothetical protein F4779DRAFT_607616 [Xylariaceae sp. FL0662B]